MSESTETERSGYMIPTDEASLSLWRSLLEAILDFGWLASEALEYYAVPRGQVIAEHGADALLLNAAGVAQVLSVSERQVERLASSGELPAPVRLGGRCVRWRVREIEQWIVGLEKTEV